MDFEALTARGQAWLDQGLVWLQSPIFLAQVAAIVVAFIVAPILSGQLGKRIPLFRDAPDEDANLLKIRQIVFKAGQFLRAIVLVALLALAATALRGTAAFGEDWLVKIAQGLATVFVVYRAVTVFLEDPLYRKIATFTLVPLSLIFVLGYWDEFTAFLGNTTLIPMGGNPITVLTLAKLAVFGSLFFWLGSLGNKRGQTAIRAQESLDIGVREILAKLFQMILFVFVAFLVINTAGIPTSGLVVVFSALSLGIGLGLQPIAANFVSGRIKSINMRSTTVSTADGKDIIVPNTDFTENSYENWTHDSPLQRYEVDFGVSYDTDLDALVPIIRDAVLEHKDVLALPDEPSVEFRSFGDSSINMCVEFWCEGVDDGPNKFCSDIGFIIWRTLKANNIEIPFPQRVIHEAPKVRAAAAPKAVRKTVKAKS
jgi:small-conductance mechanosensitive channel